MTCSRRSSLDTNAAITFCSSSSRFSALSLLSCLMKCSRRSSLDTNAAITFPILLICSLPLSFFFCMIDRFSRRSLFSSSSFFSCLVTPLTWSAGKMQDLFFFGVRDSQRALLLYFLGGVWKTTLLPPTILLQLLSAPDFRESLVEVNQAIK